MLHSYDRLYAGLGGNYDTTRIVYIERGIHIHKIVKFLRLIMLYLNEVYKVGHIDAIILNTQSKVKEGWPPFFLK